MTDGNPIIIGQANIANNPGNETSLSRNEGTARTVLVVQNLNAGDGIHGEASGGYGVQGTGDNSGVLGTSSGGLGVRGSSNSGLAGVYGTSSSGMGMLGSSRGGPGVVGTSSDDSGVLGTSSSRPGVVGNSNGSAGVLGTSTSKDSAGVLGYSPSVAGAGGAGVWGVSRTGYIGVMGDSIDTPGRILSGIGVQGSSMSGTGVVGMSPRGTGVVGDSTYSTGVRGTSGADAVRGDQSASGVYGSSDSGLGFGVSGFSESGGGVYGRSGRGGYAVVGRSGGGYGVYGSTSGSGIAVYGRATPNSGNGGYFNGGITVVNGPKAFQIDHPLEPENKYLVHNAVESSEMKNVYDGVAPLDKDGAAWVDLPDWFEALNGDFRYQLTAVGGSAPNLHVAEEISENRFKIAGGEAAMKVCWQVTGSRKDRWAEENPFEVEQDKPAEERGRYLEPSLYGAPEEQRVLIGGALAEAVEEEQRPPQPSGIDFARLEEEHRRQLDELRRQEEEHLREMEELRRRMEEHEEEVPPEST